MLLWIIIGVGALAIAFMLYCCCRAASIADRQEEACFQSEILKSESKYAEEQ